jgi:hypothetical protein
MSSAQAGQRSWSVPTATPVPATPSCVNEDGRVDSLCNSPWQTATAYCTADGLDVYRIVDSEGILVFSVTSEELAAFGIPLKVATEMQMLVAQSDDGSIRLYRLSNGDLQLNAPMGDDPNGYTFIWGGC